MDPYETAEVIEQVSDKLIEADPIEAIQVIVERYKLTVEDVERIEAS
jgi:hypothetical protein